METGMGELILLALISVMILGPRETHRIAHKLGTWLRQIRLLGDEFKRELQREADVLEWRERAREIERSILDPTPSAASATVAAARVEYDGRDLSGLAAYHPPEADPSANSASLADSASDAPAGIAVEADPYSGRPDLAAAPVTDDYAETPESLPVAAANSFSAPLSDPSSDPSPDVLPEIDALAREGDPAEPHSLAPEASARA